MLDILRRLSLSLWSLNVPWHLEGWGQVSSFAFTHVPDFVGAGSTETLAQGLKMADTQVPAPAFET